MEDKDKENNNSSNIGNVFTSRPIKVKFNSDEHDFYRADIIFYGVDHSGPSYEGRIFINNSKANGNTLCDETNGYAGSYFIFGHGGCYGDIGHCDLMPRRPYDSRPRHALTPAVVSINATNAIKKALKETDTITITIVPIIAVGGRMSHIKDVIHLERIRINGYENYSKIKNRKDEINRSLA